MRSLLSLALALLVVAPAFGEQLEDRAFKKLKRQLAAQAAQGDHEGLAATIGEIGRDDSERAVELLLKTALAVPEGKVFAATSQALGAMRSEEALEALIDPIERRGGHPGVKILCIDALAAQEDPRSAAALGAALDAKRPEVLRAAVGAIRKRKARAAVPGLIDLLEELQEQPNGLLEHDVTDALYELTGQSFEAIADWRKYWQVARERPMTGSARQGTGERVKKPRPTFFGTEIASDRLVFVIDVSGSMQGERMQKCKDQLKRCVEALTAASRFTIVAFSSSVKTWQRELQPATPRMKDKACRFVDGLQASGATYTLSAMLAGFEVEGADAIVLLSDGAPTETDPKTGERITEEAILDEVRGANGFKRWRIDTFGFGGVGAQFNAFMKDLAEQHGGKFTPID